LAIKIKILSEQLSNKIAAGEVVERPASVVKELIENSLDAEANDIIVETEIGGKRLIKVSDNGFGMSKEDALLALERHATSKIADDNDLFNISTLGFRGEALPSTASVSRFTIASRERGSIEGTEIYAEGGKIRDVKAFGMAEGSIITVRNLFFNTPARLKFMKSNETESGHIGDVLTRLALSRPDIRFTWINDGKTVFKLLPGDMLNRASNLLGVKNAGKLFNIEFKDGDIEIYGLLSAPEISRSTSGGFYTYINGRFIRDKIVQHALMQGYKNVMEKGRYPVVLLFINLPSSEVDVNVHPTKHEVRFREQGRVHAAIQNAIESVLRKSPWLSEKEPLFTPLKPSEPSISKIESVKDALLKYSGVPKKPSMFNFPQPSQLPVREEKPVPSEPFSLPKNEIKEEAGYFSSLQIIGQFRSAYIICQDNDDLILIDQHAAHERVVFQELKSSFSKNSIEKQGLLFPETLELSHGEVALLKEFSEELDNIGFELEDFGGNTWILKAVPRILSNGEYLKALKDILEELGGAGSSGLFKEKVDDILATVACHSVVRGSHPLSASEIKHLFARMDSTDFASGCPHGRPVISKITLREIEKMFKRV